MDNIRFQIPMPPLSGKQRQLFDVLERNARRLLADARIMLQNASYGSATSLAILSMEESGKFWMLAFYFSLEDRQLAKRLKAQLRSHSFKQLHSLLMLSGFAFWQAASSLVEEADHPTTVDRFIHTHKWLTEHPEQDPDLADLSKRVEAELEHRAERWLRDTGFKDLFEQIRDKQIDLAKQSGFYVDFDPDDYSIKNDPNLATAEEANYYVRLADMACRCFLKEDRN
jgi:AbiV family abortive infection protein